MESDKSKKLRRKYCNRREGVQLEKKANIITSLRGYNMLLSQLGRLIS
jgi:hypothetical protein